MKNCFSTFKFFSVSPFPLLLEPTEENTYLNHKLKWNTRGTLLNRTFVHPNLRRPSFLFTFSFKHTHFCIADMDLKKGILLKRNKLFTIIKTTTKHKNLSQIYIIRRLSSCLVVYNIYSSYYFFHNGNCLESWFSWLEEGGQKTLKKNYIFLENIV